MDLREFIKFIPSIKPLSNRWGLSFAQQVLIDLIWFLMERENRDVVGFPCCRDDVTLANPFLNISYIIHAHVGCPFLRL